MLRRFINFIRNDYASVKCAVKVLSNNRIPNAVIVLYYCIFGAILIPLYFPAKWICDYYIKGLLKDIDKES